MVVEIMTDERFEFGLKLVREAGETALGYFNNRDALKVESKGLQDLVSQADVETEKLIRGQIKSQFPDDAFFGEETGRTEYSPEQGIWVVDPIDGTQPFIVGLSCWCVSIAFVKAGKLQFGMVYAPARNELFAGGVNHPATLNGKQLTPRHAASLRDGLTGAGYSPKSTVEEFLAPFEGLLRAGGMFYREGSGALSLCYVAAGRLIGFFEPVIKSYDCLGAIAVIHAAGLKTNDFLANDGLWKGNWLIAGSPAVYAELAALTGYR
jgi:myo-inositol-1(or 4)-monophosphatase